MLEMALDKHEEYDEDLIWGLTDPVSTFDEMVGYVCRKGWDMINCRAHSPMPPNGKHWTRPVYEILFSDKDKRTILILAVHAPSPAHQPESKKWYTELNSIAAECYKRDKDTPLFLIGDLNIAEKGHPKWDWKKFFDKWKPTVEIHSKTKTTVRKSGLKWSESYDKILQWKEQVDPTNGKISKYADRYKVDNRWEECEEVRKYSDHTFLLWDIEFRN